MKGLAICSKGTEDITALEIKEFINSKAEIKDGCVIFNIKKQEDLCLLCYKAQSVDRILFLFDNFEFRNNDVSEIIPPNKISGLETPSTTRSGMISEHVKNHPTKGGASKICHPPQKVVFNDLSEKIKEAVNKIELNEWLGKNKKFRVSSEIINNSISSAELNENVGEIIFNKFKNKVSLENPDLIFFVFINENSCYLGIDFAGFELKKRQYRIFTHAAALRATIAYSLVRIADYKEDEILLDAFTGSGTIPTESALFISGFPVNYYNKEKFAFLKFKGIKFDFAKEDKKIKKEKKPKIFGYDSFLGCITNAKKNAKIAGIEKFINFARVDVEWLDTKFGKGKVDRIASNPPVLSKNKNEKDIEKLYNEFFYQAEFILNDKGKIVLITNENSLGLLKKAAEKNKFKITEKRNVMHGKEEKVVVVFGK